MTIQMGTRSRHPLSIDDIRRYAPSVFASHAATSTSDKYRFIPTIDVLENLLHNGFQPVHVSENGTRIAEKQGYTKHTLTLRRIGEEHRDKALGMIIPEIVLTNSHDGSSVYRFNLGLNRLVCLNGMTIRESDLTTSRVRHSGLVEDIVNAAFSVINTAPLALEAASQMHDITLAPDEQRIFADSALALKYESDKSPITSSRLLTVRRPDDAAPTLWNTMQRVQENLLQGGQRGYNVAASRNATTREVKNASKRATLNEALWTLAAKMAEFHGVTLAV